MIRSYLACIAGTLLIAVNVRAAENSGQLAGTIIGRETSTNRLTVAHEEVKGLMGAMTMPYEVRSQKVGALPKDGTKITATLYRSDGTFWLTDIKAADVPPAHEQPMSGMQMETPPGQAGMSQPATEMLDHGMQAADVTSDFLMRQSSGTSMNPAAAPMHMTMTERGDWTLMLHGLAFVNQVVQSGPRGGDKLFSTNWIMGMADRPLGGGRLLFRSMLSLEPLTTGRKYPELFQTGETIGGRPIIDAQHPHDLFMEIAAEYAYPLSSSTIAYLYAAPFGDPALGPVAYPHRASASEIPQAALSHHVQDSTHIAGSVLTLGAQSGMFGYAVSGFHGREPDENRWNIDTGRIDSWAARLSFDPSPRWTAQISTGHLKHPEAAEPGDVQRTTGSIAYSNATSAGQWDTSLIFGHNRKSAGHATSSWLAESVLQSGSVNYVTGRVEVVDKDELFAEQAVPGAIAHGSFPIKALTAGYSRDVLRTASILGAVGANVTRYSLPAAIKPYYGNPHSFYLFIRLRGMGEDMRGMHSMHM